MSGQSKTCGRQPEPGQATEASTRAPHEVNAALKAELARLALLELSLLAANGDPDLHPNRCATSRVRSVQGRAQRQRSAQGRRAFPRCTLWGTTTGGRS